MLDQYDCPTVTVLRQLLKTLNPHAIKVVTPNLFLDRRIKLL